MELPYWFLDVDRLGLIGPASAQPRSYHAMPRTAMLVRHRSLATLLAITLLCAGCASAPPPTPAALPTAPAAPTADTQALQASVAAAARATLVAQAVAATIAVPTATRMPTSTPHRLVFTKLAPFRHGPAGLAGLMPAGWSLVGDEHSLAIRSAPAQQISLTATLTLAAQLPADGPASTTNMLFEQIKQSGLQTQEDRRLPDGGGRMTLVDGSGLTTTYVRATMTERGLLAVTMIAPTDLMLIEKSSGLEFFDSIRLSGDYLTSVPCVLPLEPRAATEEDAWAPYKEDRGNLFAPTLWYGSKSLFINGEIGDFNGDGRDDIAVASSTYISSTQVNQLSIILQGQDGALGEPTCYSLGGGDFAQLVGRLGGDGRDDVVVYWPAQQSEAFFSTSPAIFDTRRTLASGEDFSMITVGDLDSDGRDEFVLHRPQHETIDVLSMQDDGALIPMLSIPTGVDGYHNIIIADVNDDGLPDIVAQPIDVGADGTLQIALQQPGRSFSNPVSYKLAHTPRDIAIGDIDADGHTDIVFSSSSDSQFSSLVPVFNLGTNGLIAERASYTISGPPGCIRIADIDGDTRNDLVVAHIDMQHLSLLRQQPDGSLGAEETYFIFGGTSSVLSSVRKLDIGDLNGDGRTDIIVVGAGFSLLYGARQ